MSDALTVGADSSDSEIAAQEAKVAALVADLAGLQRELGELTDAAAELARAAQEKRAEIGTRDKGFLVGLFGMEKTQRRVATLERSALATQVAAQRSRVQEMRATFNERKRRLRDQLVQEKQVLRELKAAMRASPQTRKSVDGPRLDVQLAKVAELHQKGALSDDEFAAAKGQILRGG